MRRPFVALYYHFDNKEALGYAVVDEVIASKVDQKWVQPLRNAKNPIHVLIRTFQSESLRREGSAWLLLA